MKDIIFICDKKIRLTSRAIWKSNDLRNASIYNANNQSQSIIASFNCRHKPTIIKTVLTVSNDIIGEFKTKITNVISTIFC